MRGGRIWDAAVQLAGVGVLAGAVQFVDTPAVGAACVLGGMALIVAGGTRRAMRRKVRLTGPGGGEASGSGTDGWGSGSWGGGF